MSVNSVGVEIPLNLAAGYIRLTNSKFIADTDGNISNSGTFTQTYNGTGTAHTINHTGASGNIAEWQEEGVTQMFLDPSTGLNVSNDITCDGDYVGGLIDCDSLETGVISASSVGITNSLITQTPLSINAIAGTTANIADMKLNSVSKFKVNSDGYIILSSIPTSSAGLPVGAVWSDSGTLKIV